MDFGRPKQNTRYTASFAWANQNQQILDKEWEEK
jgi:hypothetical protein